MSIEVPTGERGVFRYNKQTGKLEQIQTTPTKQVNASAYVITDEISPTETMVDNSGKLFTSKAKLRDYMHEHNKRYGTSYVETGGEQPKPQTINREERRKQIWEAAAKAWNAAKYGMAPMTEKEKERCLREERMYQEYVRRMRG